ncbi:type VI secretion system-associated FHA domain protein TagH [Phyllobacterium sp. YR531]|uniref:type VI secretion system-associated FHA domain protein TagH n=1 Tax=Phyllobacterium sp. YR531 TaxID=1144343 RepID=UPI00026FBBB6|nr:type VI secretion system-associated FHA domain protein TagH [Phyllobacterium sp. YR531]EJM97816.1 type VI secretion system FHA domain protein [Phyllobacterium sp. YR531]
MRLVLRLENRSLHGDDVIPEYVSDQRNFTIGRAEEADWTLPDRSRFVSTTHCKVEYDEDSYWAEDLSANGLLINDEEVQKSARRVLSAGDLIEIGPYQLRVFFEKPVKVSQPSDFEQTVVMPLNTEGPLREMEDRTMFLGVDQLATMQNHQSAPALPEKPQQVVKPRPSATPQTGTSRERFIEHFARGAGLDPEALAGRQDDEFAEQLGQIFRTVVPGLTQLLTARAEMRSLIRSTRQTVLKANNNNPMKFIPEPTTALAALFGANKLEYLDAGNSFTEAIDELKQHEQAVFQAMQTALFRLLNELSPDAIEASTPGSLLSGKGAYWTRYVKAWSERNLPHENGILDVFLHYFGEAYDDKIGREPSGEK